MKTAARRAALALAAACCFASTAVVGSAGAADPCPNAAIRAEQGAEVLLLPDCRALEMVSPPQKSSQPAKSPEVSASGDRIMFRSSAALGGTPGVLNIEVEGDLYVASRDQGSGWSTSSTVAPAPFNRGWDLGEARSLTPDFSRWFILASTAQQFSLGNGQLLHGMLGGVFEPFSSLLEPAIDGGSSLSDVAFSSPQGASSDHSHLFFRFGQPANRSASFLPHDPTPAGPGADFNIYIAQRGSGGAPLLELMARDDDGAVWGGNCGARVGGISDNEKRNQGAVSLDGTRVFFSTRPTQPASGNCNATTNKLRILARVESEKGPVISELFPSAPGGGDDLYQGASVDGTKVYFTTNRQLAGSDLDTGSACNSAPGTSNGCDLYLFDASEPFGERLIQVSAGENVPGNHEAGKSANVLNGTTAISGDGSHVYFVAEAVLTGDGNPEGEEAEAGKPNLYLYRRDGNHPDGELAFVGTLDPGDHGGLWGSEGTFFNDAYPVPVMGQDEIGREIGGDGHILLFLSKAPLTADDADGTQRDVYRYDAAADQLERVSRSAPGGSDDGAFEVRNRRVFFGNNNPGTEFAERGRWTSEDGRTVVFQTTEGLLPSDGNGVSDSYLWRDGQLARLPGTSNTPSSLGTQPVLSHDGATVAFLSTSRLLPQDGDTAADVYVARAGGGFPNPVVESPCQPDASLPGPRCRDESASADFPGAASAGFVGAGNPTVKPRPCGKGKRKVMRKGKRVCIKPKRRRGSRQAGSSKRIRHANTNRRAGK